MNLRIQFFVIFFILLFGFNTNVSFSQIKKFGNVSATEFEMTNDDAVILFKHRETKLIFHNMSGWTLQTTVHERIKINTIKGIDFATKKIKLYNEHKNNDELFNIRAVTYNLKGKEIVRTKFSRKSIYKKELNDRWTQLTFTMPDLNENSIVEWQYTINSNYIFYIDDIVLQEDLPMNYFRATINVPGDHVNFIYRFLNKIKVNIINERGLYIENWNVPKFKKEKYTRNIELYRPRIVFDVYATNFPNSSYKVYSKTWDDVAKQLNADQHFGLQLKKTKYFKKELSQILSQSTSKKDSILAIFDFVKNKVKWNGVYSIFSKKGVKATFNEKSGNVAEINMILVSMLRKAGFNADPVILSTRNMFEAVFPTILKVNYVICYVELGNGILLDASNKNAYYNLLPFRVLNGVGRVIKKDNRSFFVDLSPKTFAVTKRNINMEINSSGLVSGNFRIAFKGEKAIINRNKFTDLDDMGLEFELRSQFQNTYVYNVRLYNKNKLDKPFLVLSKFNLNNNIKDSENKMILSVMTLFKQNEKIIEEDSRKYPIEFGYPFKEITIQSIKLPEGFKITKLPDDIVEKSANGEIAFSFSFKQENNILYIKKILISNAVKIAPKDYLEFKRVITELVKTENRSIVLISNK